MAICSGALREYTDYRQMLEQERPDLVSVVPPDDHHAAPVIAAAESGVKGIICEKPLAGSLADADRMIEAVERSGYTAGRGAASAVNLELSPGYDEEAEHPVNAEIRETVAHAGWIKEAAVRLRDTGHVFNVEVLAVPVDAADDPIAHAEELTSRLRDVDWKVQDVVVAVVPSLEDAPDDVLV
jgi:hypothetical protein